MDFAMSTTPTTNPTSFSVVDVIKTENCNGKTKTSVPFSYTYGSVCLLCLRTKTCTTVKSEPEKHRQSRSACIKYVVLLSRYLKLDTELTKISNDCYFNPFLLEELVDKEDLAEQEARGVEEVGKFIICDCCLPIAESFCKTYLDFELLKMKLESKVLESAACVTKSEVLGDSLRVIKGIKRSAASNKATDPNLEEGVLMGFRNELKAQGATVKKRNEPKLLLKRDRKVDELVQKKKVLKLSSAVPSPAISEKSVEDFNKTEISTPSRSNPDVQIVRKPPGSRTSTPDISIIRINRKPPTPATYSSSGSDVEVIDVVPKNNRSNVVSTITSAPPSPAIPHVQVFSSVPKPKTRVLLQNPVPVTTLTPTTVQNTYVQYDFASHSLLPKSSNMPPVPPDIKTQICNINACGIAFPKTEQGYFDILRHLDTHDCFQCSQCPDMMTSPLELISHELKHEELNPNRKAKQGFQCPRCPHYSTFRTEYQEHFLERHLNTKIYLLKCQLCKRGFSYKKEKQYRTHLATSHPDETKDDLSQCHSCMICRVFFKKKTNLWKHLKSDHRINCQEGPYKCSQCPEAFAFQSLLQLHNEFGCESLQIHKCPYLECLSTFKRADLLKKHIDRVHNTLNALSECPICKVVFNDQEALIAHVITHNGEQVKLVFPDGGSQEPQVIPLDSCGILPTETLAPNPINLNPVQAYQNQNLVQGHNLLPNVYVPLTLTPPPSVPTPPPVIVAVSASKQNPVVIATHIPPVSTTHPVLPNNQTQATGVVQPAEFDMKLFEQMFEESNDSQEQLMEFFDNAIQQAEGAGNNEAVHAAQPDEDPFAWMLSEDFEIT